MARRRAASSRRRQTPGWVFMLVGLGLGLVVAAAIYLSGAGVREPEPRGPATPSARVPARDQRPPASRAASGRNATSGANATNATDGGSDTNETADVAAVSAEDDGETRFDFYDILPRYEVVVPEVESVTSAAGESAAEASLEPVAIPGSYVLQTGSFRSYDDADRMQASLALLGIESHIQKVTIDDDVFHRVRVGPIDDLEQLNRLRTQLRGAGVEPLMMKVNP